MNKSSGFSAQTRLIRAGSTPEKHGGAVSPPAQRASTLLMEKSEHLYASGHKTYGMAGMDAHDALCRALCELEGAEQALLVPSGLLACTLPIWALSEPGAHILVTDNVYGPTRRFCECSLRQWGVQTEYFAPDIKPEALGKKIRSETRLIFLESPGSLTFEMSDTAAIVQISKKAGIALIFDNTYGAGLFYRPLEHGVDISVQATTKYPSGHSDVISGAIMTCDSVLADRLSNTARNWGLHVAAEDAWLVLRGLKSMKTRMAQHQQSALELATWLQKRSEVMEVLYPALPGDRFHALWKQDFTGAAGLFSVVLRPCPEKRVHAFLDSLHLFGLGFSWGGFESLAIPCDPQLHERALSKNFSGPVLRFNIGLEAVEDLQADLQQALPLLRV